MKKVKILTILIFAGVLFYACENKTKQENEALKAEIALLADENAAFAEGVFEQEHSIENYQAMLEEINQQLATIDEKHELVKSKTVEYKNDAQIEEEILLHIEHLQHQMENTKHKISHMQKNMDQLRKENEADKEKIEQMDNFIDQLANMVVTRDKQINELHGVVSEQGIDIAVLQEAYEEQAQYSEVLLDILNTGYYVAGTKKELKEMGIIDMKGGLIGVGRVKTLNADASLEFLTPIDIRDTDMIELIGKKAELISPHPVGSYEFTFNKENKSIFLGISNKLEFWQGTKYLVVEVTK